MPVNTSAGVQAATGAQVANAAFNIGATGTAVGSFLGMPVLALMLGAGAGALVHARNQETGIWQVVWGVLASTLLAGAFTPAAVLGLMHQFRLGAVWEQPLHLAVPVVIGGGWAWALPLAANVAQRLLDSWVAKIGGKS